MGDANMTLCCAQVWNYVNGECLKRMQTTGNAEVTGLVHILERSQFLVTGWNRRITSFPDEPDVRQLAEPHRGILP